MNKGWCNMYKDAKIAVFERGSAEWLAFRRGFVTATEMSIILGMNKYETPGKLLERKLNPEFTDNVFTRMGRILEPAVANLTEEVVGRLVNSFSKNREDFVIYSDSMKCSATLDAYIGEDKSNPEIVVELKTTSASKQVGWRTDYPFHYLTQLALQCVLSGAKIGYLTIMTPQYPDLPHTVYEFRPTEDDIQELTLIFSEQANKFIGELGKADGVFRKNAKVFTYTVLILSRSTKIISESTIDIFSFNDRKVSPWEIGLI